MAATARAKAPCRVDLAGGTLDIWPLGLLHPGCCTVNVAVGVEVAVEIGLGGSEYRVEQGGREVGAATVDALLENPETALFGLVARAAELPPSRARIASDSPRGAGLGASSALAIALIAASERLVGGERSSADRVHLARDLEAQLMSLPTGVQDHYPAVLGGALRIDHAPGGESVSRLDVDLERLGRHLLLVYTGQTHVSAVNNWEIVRRRLDGGEESRAVFAGIAEVGSPQRMYLGLLRCGSGAVC